MWERNTKGLREAGLKRRNEAITRTEKAIQSLIREGKNITFNAVIQRAGVSKSWLYRQPDLKERINALRSQSVRAKKRPTINAATDHRKDTMISALRDQVKELKKEMRALEMQLQVAYGLVNDQDVVGLQQQITTLTEKLENSEYQTESAIKDHQATVERNKRLRTQNKDMNALKTSFDVMEQEIKELKQQNSYLMTQLQREQHIEREKELKGFAKAVKESKYEPIPNVEF